MKILVISHEYPPIGGGGANACHFLSREYARLGHQVTIVTAAYKDLPEEENLEGVRIIRVKAKRTKEDKSTFYEMFTFLKSAYFYADKLCKNEHFDICQVYFGIPSGPIGVHLKRKYKIPYVIRFGGGDIPGAQKRFGFVYKVLAPEIRSIWKNAAALVANSEVLKARAQEFEDMYPIQIINNGVDSDFFTPDPSKRENAQYKINIIFVSRLIEGKGLQYVIPGFKEIAEKTSAHLTIVGDGPYREALEKLTDENGAREHVTFAGRKNKQELYPYYNNADLFILPSLSEGMPNVALEAMSMGLPILITPCGGSKELIDGNGIISEIEDFNDNLIKLCEDEALRKAYGEVSFERVRTLFAWKQKAEEYLGIFEKIV